MIWGSANVPELLVEMGWTPATSLGVGLGLSCCGGGFVGKGTTANSVIM